MSESSPRPPLVTSLLPFEQLLEGASFHRSEEFFPSALHLSSLPYNLASMELNATKYVSKFKRRAGISEFKEMLHRGDRYIEESKHAAYEPHETKHLRPFPLMTVCSLLGIHHTKFYEIVRSAPQLGGTKADHSRLFTLSEIHKLQAHLGKLPRQVYKIERAIRLSIANFKGGVAKTFTAVTLAQYFALRGYRTLVVDLDPQGSLTTSFGLNPARTDDWQTILPYFYGEKELAKLEADLPKSLAECIQPTHWDGLDILAASLNLYAGDFRLEYRKENKEPGFILHRQLSKALATVDRDYDLIIIDNPPALSFTTNNAIFAADGLIIPTPAEMMDYESTKSFIKLATELMEYALEHYGEDKVFEIFRILVTRFQNTESNQKFVKALRWIFNDFVINEPMVHSSAIQKLTQHFTSLYEVLHLKVFRDGKGKMIVGRDALKRAGDAGNDVNRQIELLVIDLLEERKAPKEPPAETVSMELEERVA